MASCPAFERRLTSGTNRPGGGGSASGTGKPIAATAGETVPPRTRDSESDSDDSSGRYQLEDAPNGQKVDAASPFVCADLKKLTW